MATQTNQTRSINKHHILKRKHGRIHRNLVQKRRVNLTLLQESPHEHQQSLLLSRIIVNVEKLNEAIMMLNKNLQEINIQNMDTELVAQMFKNYQSNVLFHLEATNGLKDPA
ncbi:uncharacterized protein K460DRAFT_409995 [Cucurbitaria berberidis CBS 394.84]|uniref:DASH complex subunit DAD4 n=2 Tax=Pleosporineae TaxID=715340 RepID=A0A9P4GBR1_9PLEO|nr:uncharacterized protein K460DRAFT_409995 [Cucurbitaria berberidis CBS 394.84]KAF1842594.1 hypothetical protein K460DRAFT_409995 [Cucurbitaria berberidis CBS 394.84]